MNNELRRSDRLRTALPFDYERRHLPQLITVRHSIQTFETLLIINFSLTERCSILF